MKLINLSYEILEQSSGLEGIYKAIERAARTCYKSEDKITENSAKKFVDMLIARGHTAMLEHGTVYLMERWKETPFNMHLYSKWDSNPYTKIVSKIVGNDIFRYITTNYRVLLENDWLDDLKYLCEPTEYHEKRVTVKFSTDIGVTRELNRQRADSIAEQSTRYCNYSKDKFGNEISICVPEFIKNYGDLYKLEHYENSMNAIDAFLRNYCHSIANNNEDMFSIIDWWIFANTSAELAYINMIKLGAKPEEARTVLPLDTNSELIHTAFVSDWKHCFDLRVNGITGNPHPDMKALMTPVKEEFIKRKLI